MSGPLARSALLALAAIVAVTWACSRRVAPPRPGESHDAHVADAEEACLDGWLAAHGMDPFGSPEGTVYGGGSPLFDEQTGRSVTRTEHVYRLHPEARRACASDASKP
ncbi:MAG TPA: hypothetical protein VE987_18380 [Polyangiaceae bacterium]|nr:hypothetical protein [Polyangiaceae bacterium]